MVYAVVARLLFRRMRSRTETKVAVTIALGFVLAGFIETCMQFYGADMGELPTPATAWAWNIDAMRVNSMRVYLFFFAPVLAGLMFADSARADVDSGFAPCIAARCSTNAWFTVHAVASFLGGFAITLGVLALLQALAFTAFPADGTFTGRIGVPVWQGAPWDFGFLSELSRVHPYAFNLVFALWTSCWMGACALLSFALTFLLRKGRVLALLLPMLIPLALFQILPRVLRWLYEMLPYFRAYPGSWPQPLDLMGFVAPLVFLFAAALACCVAARRKEDVLL